MPEPTGVTLDFVTEATDKQLPGSQVYEQSAHGIGSLISSLMNAIMVIGILMVLFFLVFGAVEWITSGGEKSKVESARNKMTHAVIGIIILASSLAIFLLVQRFIGVEIVRVQQPTLFESIRDLIFRGLGG